MRKKATKLFLSVLMAFTLFGQSANALSIPGLPTGVLSGEGLLTPYGGINLFSVVCTGSGSLLHVVFDFRTKLVFPVHQSIATIYHTPQNIGFLMTPGNYQLGNLRTPEVCIIGLVGFGIPIPAFGINNFGNGGPPMGGL